MVLCGCRVLYRLQVYWQAKMLSDCPLAQLLHPWLRHCMDTKPSACEAQAKTLQQGSGACPACDCAGANA